MAHPWSKNLQKLSWPDKNSMALQSASQHGSSIFSSTFLYVSYAPEGPCLHYAMTVWTNIHSLLYPVLIGRLLCPHSSVWCVTPLLVGPPTATRSSLQAQMLFTFSPQGEIAVWQPLPLILVTAPQFSLKSQPSPNLRSQDLGVDRPTSSVMNCDPRQTYEIMQATKPKWWVGPGMGQDSVKSENQFL